MTRKYALSLLVAVLFLVLSSQDGWAIPAFARKYGTSCHTCHVAYPKLNPFGNAFRLRGYRMPEETEDMIKEVPVEMGQEAYKRVWPDAVWPSDIPGTAPLSVDIRSATTTFHNAEEDETFANDLRFPETIDLLAGGTFGDTLSFLGSVGFALPAGEGDVEVDIGHAELHFNGPFGSGNGFNAKVGRFTPEMTQGFSHGYLLTSSTPASMLGFNPIGFHGSEEVAGLGHAGGHHGGGGTGISLPVGVEGVEAYGIVDHRFLYSGGISNGIGPGEANRDANEAKDFFGRVAYKFGGLSLDGEEGMQQPQNWRETSAQVGLFGYRGDGEDILFAGTGHHANTFAEDRDFSRVGVDVNVYVRDLNIIAGFVHGTDTLAEYEADEHGEADEHAEEEEDEHAEVPSDLVLEEVGDFDWDAWFVEADYVFYPWLHGAVRYEWLDPSDPRREAFKRVSVNGTALIRANVKALIEYQRNLGGQLEDDYLIRGALRFAF